MNMCLSLATTLCLLPVGDPPNDRGPADAIPASAYVAVEFPGLDACREQWDGFQLARLFEPMIAPARDAALESARGELRALDRMLATLEIERDMVRTLLRRPLAVGLGRVTF
ncbi:MAG: hypothetical protein KDB80_04545, partial [Planctomycetes bacterium]|nr:hypothetical protein [Planctomycetota bacterium]